MISFRLTHLAIGCSLLMLPAATVYISIALPQPVVAQTQSHSEYTGVVKEVDEIAQQITVRIDSKNNGNGSGVIVAKDENTYYVLTAAHVVKNSDTYTLVAPDGQKHLLDASKITLFKGVDLAVVQFASSRTYTVATLANYGIAQYQVSLSDIDDPTNIDGFLSVGFLEQNH
ncbi:hypothetical protein HC931_06745 [Candidatus Gracilibacteria bacterium]|nr:hypothetical protein [Candidatus Gracilibacteria bacterium]